jgi:hypothetical protein
MPPAERGFRTPPEITRYFADKGLRPAFSWLDVWGQEHAYAFTVAKAVETELLALFKNSIQRALENGQGFETWRQGLVPELQRLGWYGKRRVDDPTGAWNSKVVDFSRPRRLETIFWSNVRSARAAGQWERIQRTKRGLPYLLYVRTTSAEPRPQHLAWAGTILPVDHIFWATHFPPNGWHCKCSVRQISRYEYAQLEGKDGYSIEPPTIETKPFVNARTGEVLHVPAGIDPGWGTNPGLARARTLIDNVTKQFEAAGETAARARISELMDSPAPKILLGIEGERIDLPIAVAGKLAEEWRAASNLITVSNETMRRKIAKHAAVEVGAFAIAQRIVDEGQLIDEGKGDNRRTLLAQVDGAWWKLVLSRTRRGFMRIATLFRTNSNEAERVLRKHGGA